MTFLSRYGAFLMVIAALDALPILTEVARRAIPDPPAPARYQAIDPGATGLMQEDIGDLEFRIEELRKALAEQRARLEAFEDNLALALRSGVGSDGPTLGQGEGFTMVMLLTGRRSVNADLRLPGSSFLERTLGPPRLKRDFNQDCQKIDNPRLKANMALMDVGPFKVYMLRAAAQSLKRVFDEVKKYEPELYKALGTAGSMCARFIRGSKTAISSHSFGTAVDVTIGGVLDKFGDGSSQQGLILLAEYFFDEGWYWGAAFGREDSMHFEVSRFQWDKWVATGEIDLSIPLPEVAPPAAEGEGAGEDTGADRMVADRVDPGDAPPDAQTDAQTDAQSDATEDAPDQPSAPVEDDK